MSGGFEQSRTRVEAPADRRGYSVWDTLKDLRFAWPWFVGATPHAARRARASRRTEAFERAAEHRTDLRALADELARRRRLWERNFDPAPDGPDGASSGRRGSGRARDWLPELLFFGIDELAWLAVLAGITAMVASVALGVVLAIPWLVWHVARARRRAACRRAMDLGHCPDCGYDLAGTPTPFDAPEIPELSTGPRRCPECGSPWPLVPPPVR